MYPETDVKPVDIAPGMLSALRKAIPETIGQKRKRFVSDLKLNSELCEAVISSRYLHLFDSLSSRHSSIAKDIANVFVNILGDLKARETLDVDSLPDSFFEELFEAVEKSRLSKDAIALVISGRIKSGGKSVTELLSQIRPFSKEDAIKIIKEAVSSNKNAPESALMGLVMEKLRGKISGRIVAELVRSEMGKNKKQKYRYK